MKKNYLKAGLLATLFTLMFIACSDNDDNEPWVKPEFGTTGAFILNEGQFGSNNNSKISYYNTSEGKLTVDVFENQNSQLGLGKGAQDVLIYGAKMYITVTESNILFVTNLEGKLLEKGEMSFTETLYKKPRHLVAHNGSVYVDFYSGHVAKLDTTELKVIATKEIPAFPEQMAIANNELYITNSQYYESGLAGNTLTVMDLNTMEIKEPITVRVNPTKIISDNLGNLVVLSNGVYGSVKSAVSIIDSKTKKVTKELEDVANQAIAIQDGKVLLANRTSEYDVETEKTTSVTKYSQYDIYTQKYSETPFIKIPEAQAKELGKSYHISVDPNNNDIYVSTTDYTTTGSMYIFDAKGEYKTHFKTGGVSPQKVEFITAQIK